MKQRPIPDIQASPVLVQAVKHLLKTPQKCDHLLNLVIAEITQYLWADANFCHARVIGEKLAMSLGIPYPDEAFSHEFLQRDWDGAFSWNPVPHYPLGIHGAHDFASCLESFYPNDGKRKRAVESFYNHIKKLYPMPGAGVFDGDDINW